MGVDLNKSKLSTVHTPSLEIQHPLIYKQENSPIRMNISSDVQRQKNGYDYGLFAIANLVEFFF